MFMGHFTAHEWQEALANPIAREALLRIAALANQDASLGHL